MSLWSRDDEKPWGPARPNPPAKPDPSAPPPKGDQPPLGDSHRARIIEIFSSAQGEGTLLAEPMVFVRFGGCNLRCDYCDSPETIPIPSGELQTLDDVTTHVIELAYDGPRWVSFTGGEPLLHDSFLRGLLPRLRDRGLKMYLETNGILPDRLKSLVHWIDQVSMDIKPPSAVGVDRWDAHEAFLRVAPEKTLVKMVLTSKTEGAEVRRAAELIAAVKPDIPFFMQPATPIADVTRPTPEAVLSLLRHAKAVLPDVRLSPQWHPVWKVP